MKKEPNVIYRFKSHFKKLRSNVYLNSQLLNKRYGSSTKKAIKDDFLLILSLVMPSDKPTPFNIGISVKYKDLSFSEQTITASYCKHLTFKDSPYPPYEKLPDKKAIFYSREYSYEEFRVKLNKLVDKIAFFADESLGEYFCKLMEIETLEGVSSEEIEKIQKPLVSSIESLLVEEQTLNKVRKEKEKDYFVVYQKCVSKSESTATYKKVEELRAELKKMEQVLSEERACIFRPAVELKTEINEVMRSVQKVNEELNVKMENFRTRFPLDNRFN